MRKTPWLHLMSVLRSLEVNMRSTPATCQYKVLVPKVDKIVSGGVSGGGKGKKKKGKKSKTKKKKK